MLPGEVTWKAAKVVMEINVYKEKVRKDEEEMDK